MDRRGQSWSIDIVLAVVVFGFVAIAFTSFTLLDQPDVERLQQTSQRVTAELQSPFTTQLGDDCGPILVNDSLQTDELECVFRSEEPGYFKFKDDKNIDGDFCIFIEDQSGAVIRFEDANGWGSQELLIDGTPCGQIS